MKAMVCAVLALALAAPVVLGEEKKVDNPQYKSWAAYKPGTMVKQKMTSKMTMGDQETTTKTTITKTLKKLTAEKAVLAVVVEINVGGNKITQPAREQEVPAKVAKEAATQPAVPPGTKMTKKGEGDETITVGGKKYKTHWIEWHMVSDSVETTTKNWTSDKVPGRMVKMTSDMTKPMKVKSTLELVEIKIAK